MSEDNPPFILARNALNDFIQALIQDGYSVIGPTIRDEAIIYDQIQTDRDLPVGWTEEREAGTYKLKKRNDDVVFGFTLGPHSWKKFLFPPKLKLWEAQRTPFGIEIENDLVDPPRFAFLGVRACELSAITIQDRVFLENRFTDPVYKARRENALVIAINCGQAAGTCFCASMQTGPRVTSGYDIALTEIVESDHHEFLVEIGTEKGSKISDGIPCRKAEERDLEAARKTVANTEGQMGRQMDITDIKDFLYRQYENPRWDQVASRCLACANCTLVCPTCFCSTVNDTADLTGDHAERWRTWDSCFTMDFSLIYGGSVRPSPKSHYRQWMMHKLATWVDQFDTLGCVGCGRCITWCPVGIDITEEVRALREMEAKNG